MPLNIVGDAMEVLLVLEEHRDAVVFPKVFKVLLDVVLGGLRDVHPDVIFFLADVINHIEPLSEFLLPKIFLKGRINV